MAQQRNNTLDFKDESGLWVSSYCPELNNRYTTRASKLWEAINTRCKKLGKFQTKQPTYVGVTNGFKDFQEFAEWCQHQYGYINKEENGRFWQLDKDLKVVGNKIYAPETCIFVPNRINCLFIACNSARGEFPVGVSWHSRTKKFQSRVQSGGKQRHLGSFDCPMEAHQAWQKSKIAVIRKIIVEDEEIRNHLELVPILLAQAQRIEDDLSKNKETI